MSDETERENLRQPGPDVTPELFQRWQFARRGEAPAEDLTNPVWTWMFRGCIDPYHAQELVKKGHSHYDDGHQPRWAGCRMGQSQTHLPDGRTIWIAGEHEDYYDPDFYIYNDVIVEDQDGNLQIFGYPESDFRPTDFHSATLIPEAQIILVIGSIGYPDHREFDRTQVYALDLRQLRFTEIQSRGSQPGWLGKHTAELSADGSSIVVHGGETMTDDGLLENIDEWSLSLVDYHWSRLTERRWVRFRVGREDGAQLHLWQYLMLEFQLRHPEIGSDELESLTQDIGRSPDMDSYRQLYSPPLSHDPKTARDEEEWRCHRIETQGVLVRYNDETGYVTVTIEGVLPQRQIHEIAEDFRQKLSAVENSACSVHWIER